MIEYKTCPVCGSEKIEKVLDIKDHSISKEDFEVYECSACTLRFTNPVPDPENIGRYYQSEEYVSHSDSGKGFINSLYQKVRRKTLRSKRRNVKRWSGKENGEILDIGCGTGHFLNEMKQTGWKVTGVEPGETPRKIAKEKFGIQPVPASEFPRNFNGSFDVVTMWHVLEHVHELHLYLENIKNYLKPGGTFVVAVPNYTSLDARIYKEYWAAYDVPIHLYHFSPKSMDVLLEKHGMKVRSHHIMPYDSFYVSMLSEKYRGGSILRAGWIGWRSWVNAVFNSRSCSSIIYVIDCK